MSAIVVASGERVALGQIDPCAPQTGGRSRAAPPVLVISDYEQATFFSSRVDPTKSENEEAVDDADVTGLAASEDPAIVVEIRRCPLTSKPAIESAPLSAVYVDQDPGQSLPDHCRPTPTGRPPDYRAIALVYDEVTLQHWADTGFTPGFMTGQVAEPTPTLEEAVFDVWFHLIDSDGTIKQGTFRVRRSDGAVGLVALSELGAPMSTEEPGGAAILACNAGRWWPAVPGDPKGRHPCCESQFAACTLLRRLPIIGPLLCPNCTSCYAQCNCCSVSNPCHSCGFCGFTWWFNLIGIGN